MKTVTIIMSVWRHTLELSARQGNDVGLWTFGLVSSPQGQGQVLCVSFWVAYLGFYSSILALGLIWHS